MYIADKLDHESHQDTVEYATSNQQETGERGLLCQGR